MQINLASKILQMQNMNLEEAYFLQKMNQFLHNFKETGVQSYIIVAI